MIMIIIGELIRINGGVPFSSPKSLTSSSSVPSAAAAAFDQQCVTTTIAPGFWGGEPVSITPAATVASALPNDPYVTHQKERQVTDWSCKQTIHMCIFAAANGRESAPTCRRTTESTANRRVDAT
jgi:hypothetical protein